MLLCATLCVAPELSLGRSVTQHTLSKLPEGKRIELMLNTGEHFIGNLRSVSSETFTVEPEGNRGTERVIAYDDVRSVRSKLTRTEEVAIGVLIWLALSVISLANH